MEKFKIVKQLNTSQNSQVSKATNIQTGDIVAVKNIKSRFSSWEDCLQLREIKSLRKLQHPNILKLIEVIKVNDEVHLILEYIQENLAEFIQKWKAKKQPIPEDVIQTIIYQLAQGLAYMHKQGFFHRNFNLKNILITPTLFVKICDFKHSKQINSKPPFSDIHPTLSYTAPELLLKARKYTQAVDIFSLGCIMAELYLQGPLFQADSELGQINAICQVLGTPNRQV